MSILGDLLSFPLVLIEYTFDFSDNLSEYVPLRCLDSEELAKIIDSFPIHLDIMHLSLT